MIFTEYMQSLPNQQQDTIKILAEITMSTPQSVYRWVNGDVIPPPIKQKLIADYLGKTMDELFPKIKLITSKPSSEVTQGAKI